MLSDGDRPTERSYDRRTLTWGLLWFLLAFKLPLVALAAILLWALRQSPVEQAAEDDGGNQRARPAPDRRPRPPLPRHPRRGPHGEPAPRAPHRVRARPSHARARVREH